MLAMTSFLRERVRVAARTVAIVIAKGFLLLVKD